MNTMFAALICAGVQLGEPPRQVEDVGSYLYQPSFAVDKVIRPPTRPYMPQPGDLVFAAKNDLWSVLGHIAAGTGYPNHSGVIFVQRDGTLALLEAGPEGNLNEGMAIVPLMDSLRTKVCTGRAWVRVRATPLTPQQSTCLTEYVYHEVGKRFAKIRTYAQVTPLRSRMPVRAAVMGGPDPEKSGFFCSELVLNGLWYAGLVDDCVRPSATYPRDLFEGSARNHFVDRGVRQLNDGWLPPARWTPTSDKGCNSANVNDDQTPWRFHQR